MFLPLVAEDAVWYGPATVTFCVQFPGDPFDPARNDVRVRFIGDRNQREERTATFDPVLGAWRATLYAKGGGSYRAVLIRNGKDALVEPEEGIVELAWAKDLGVLVSPGPREDRFTLDSGAAWVGLGVGLSPDATPVQIDALAKAGATWVRVVPPSDPLTDDVLHDFNAAMDAIERNGLAYTFVLPESSSAAWRRYALARFGASPRLVQWEAPADLADPWKRATATTAVPWDGLFENRRGPFLVKANDAARLKALRAVLERSEWADWKTPRLWKGRNAKGVAESDRLILLATPGATLTGVPLADGVYETTTIDPATGESATGETKATDSTLDLKVPGERFFVLRRKL